MRATGREIVSGALDLAIGYADEHDDENVAMLARHSKFLFNSLNVESARSVGGVVRRVADLAPGASSFTWGPDSGSDVVEELPEEIVAWNAISGGQEFPRGPDSLMDTERWAQLQFAKDTTGGYATYLYWPRTVDTLGRYTIHFWPTADSDAQIAVYARIPKFGRIELDGQYQLDPGRGEYLKTQLALTAASVLGMEPSPRLVQMAREAAIRVGDVGRENDLLVPSNRYMIGTRDRRVVR